MLCAVTTSGRQFPLLAAFFIFTPNNIVTNPRNPKEIDIAVGKKLKFYRKFRGLSQDSLGQALGITFQQIQKYENGTNRISAGRLYMMSQILGIEIDWLFADIDVQLNALTKFNLPSDVMERPETVELIRYYYGLKNDDVRLKMLHTLRALAG